MILMMMIIASRSSFDMWVERSLAWKVVELLWEMRVLLIFLCASRRIPNAHRLLLFIYCIATYKRTHCLLVASVCASKRKKCKIIWNEFLYNFNPFLYTYLLGLDFECAKIIVVKRLACFKASDATGVGCVCF